MKTKLMYSIVIFLICKIAFAQPFPCGLPSPILRYDVPNEPNYSNVEIRIYNQILYYGRDTSESIKVLIIPVGTFFNVDNNYSPKARTIISHKIAGIEIIIPPQIDDSSPSYISGNWDRTGGNTNESDFSYGFGKYKFEFYRRVEDTLPPNYYHWEFSNYVYIDFRDVGNHVLPDSGGGSLHDMRIDYFTKDTITFQFDAHLSLDIDSLHDFKFWHINLVNKEIKVWDKYGTCIPAYVPDKGLMHPDISDNGAYLKWPINAKSI